MYPNMHWTGGVYIPACTGRGVSGHGVSGQGVSGQGGVWPVGVSGQGVSATPQTESHMPV